MINMEISVFIWLAALLPILLLMVLMMFFHVSATRAAGIGLLVSIVSSIFVFKMSVQSVYFEALKSVWSAFPVIYVVWTALLLYEVGAQSNSFSVIRKSLQALISNELLQILAIGFVFVSFLQGITGFGVPIAVGTPLLVGIGLNPIGAVLVSVIGQAYGNTFGTLAVAWDALIIQSGLTDAFLIKQTAFWTALELFFVNFLSGLMICWLYGKFKAIKKGFIAVAAISLVQGGLQLVLSQFNTTMAAFIPASLALIVVVLLGRLKMYNTGWAISDSPIMAKEKIVEADGDAGNKKSLNIIEAVVPYLILVGISVLVLLISPVKGAFERIVFSFSFPQMSTGYNYVTAKASNFSPFYPLTNGGTFLLISAIISYVMARKKEVLDKTALRTVLKNSFKKTAPAAITILGFMSMSRMMSGSGQIFVLAQGMINILGMNYVFISPFVGLLGSFVTSSNMSSNILFSQFQYSSATLLGVSSSPLLSAQTVGGAIGSMIAPSKVILGTSAVGIAGSEGIILKKIILPVLCMTLCIGIVTLVLVRVL